MTDKPNSEKIILGIDPGTNLMGYGVLRVTGNKAVMETMGVIDLRKYAGPYLKLGRIFERVTGIGRNGHRSAFLRQKRTEHVEIGTRTGGGYRSGYPS